MASDDEQQPQKISFREFLEKIPPGKSAWVKDALNFEKLNANSVLAPLKLPRIELHCDRDFCGGSRWFSSGSEPGVNVKGEDNAFVKYVCRNCGAMEKNFALRVLIEEGLSNSADRVLFKYGEYPVFGPPTPARVITLLGPEKEYYLKGRRAEFQGMGIGAYSYYRRVVENQKNRLLDEIIRVAQKIGASQEMLDDLNTAKEETQFTKAVDKIRHGLPSGLLLNGHNPLTLLHKALSEGLHAQTDEDCLALATDIRVVLADLADRLGHALKDRAELDAAVSRLMK